MSIDSASLKALEALVSKVEADPSLLHGKELGFFKKYLTSLGAKIPDAPKKDAKKHHDHDHAESSHGHSHKHGDNCDSCCGHDHGHDDHDHGHGTTTATSTTTATAGHVRRPRR